MGQESGHTHADGIDFTNNTDGRVVTVEDVDSLIQASLVDDNFSVVLLVFLFVSATILPKHGEPYDHPLVPIL